MGNTNIAETKFISVTGPELFYISKFHVRRKHGTAFRHNKWWYSTSPECLKGKWVNVSSQNLYLTNTWDLSNSPVNIYIVMLEKDNGSTTTLTTSYTANYTDNSNIKTSGEFDTTNGNKTNKVNLELGFSSQVSKQKTVSLSYVFKDVDDPLGEIFLNFKDPIIVSDKDATTKGYEINSLNSGALDIVIAPTKIR